VSDQQLQALFTALEAGKDEGVKFWISSLVMDDFKKRALQMHCTHKAAT
jgi:hypothetical protein